MDNRINFRFNITYVGVFHYHYFAQKIDGVKIIEVLRMDENIQQTQINRILEILEGYEGRFDAIDNRFEEVDNRFEEVDKHFEERFDILSEQIRQSDKHHEERFNLISEQIQQLDKRHGERLSRLEAIAEQHDQRFIAMTTEMHRLVDKVDKVVDKVDSMYKWIIGLILGLTLPMWASLIIAILLKK